MPVYIQDPDALDRLTQVEGTNWRERQEAGQFGNCSFSAFLDEWTRSYQPLLQQEAIGTLHGIGVSVWGHGAIYGDGGWNRYTVRGDGEIMFITGLARDNESPDRARAAGFRMFPEEM